MVPCLPPSSCIVLHKKFTHMFHSCSYYYLLEGIFPFEWYDTSQFILGLVGECFLCYVAKVQIYQTALHGTTIPVCFS